MREERCSPRGKSLVLVAGGDDKVWPSSQAAKNIAARHDTRPLKIPVGARSADTAPSLTTGSGRASSRTWCSLPTTGSVSSRSPTPERSTPAARRCPSPTPCSTSRKMPCAPTSRNVPRSGVTYAAGIPSAPVCSWTPSKGPCSGPAWRSSSAATTSPSAARRRCPRCARVFGSTRTATTPTPSASTSPGSGRAPLQWCSAADPAAR